MKASPAIESHLPRIEGARPGADNGCSEPYEIGVGTAKVSGPGTAKGAPLEGKAVSGAGLRHDGRRESQIDERSEDTHDVSA